MTDFDDPPEQDRHAFVAAQLARLPIDPAAKPIPWEQRREGMKAHDALFRIEPGATISSAYKISRPRMTAGDEPEANDQ